MLLKSFKYSTDKKNDKWSIDPIHFGHFNLIVGQNATGKTKLLNTLSNFNELAIENEELQLVGNYQLIFKDEELSEIYDYEVRIENQIILKEDLKLNEEIRINRNNGDSKIYSNTNKKLMEFTPPSDKLTLQVRRDVKEYPYIEKLIEWYNNFIFFEFTGINQMKLSFSNPSNINPYSFSSLLQSLIKSENNKYPVINDLNEIGYIVDDIGVGKFDSPLVPLENKRNSDNLLYLYLKERDLEFNTAQFYMSQGMYRAFVTIVTIEYMLSQDKNMCIAIDDLGEGLDYERATKLTKLLMRKVKGSKVQIIITSNDRFLINAVDLEDITFLEREGHHVKVFNYANSKKAFDEFKSIGLNNFDMLSRKMYKDWE